MKKIILNLRKFSGLQLIVFARKLIYCITASKYFKDAAPILKKLNDAVDEYAELKQAKPISPGKFYTKNVNDLKQMLIFRIKQTVYYVQSVVYDNEPKVSEKIITSAGFEFKKYTRNYNQGFSAKCGTEPGSAKLRLKLKKNSAYLFQITTNVGDEASWKEAVISTRSIVTVKKLKRDTRYYFRAKYINAQGTSEFSEVMSVLVG